MRVRVAGESDMAGSRWRVGNDTPAAKWLRLGPHRLMGNNPRCKSPAGRAAAQMGAGSRDPKSTGSARREACVGAAPGSRKD